MIKQTTICIEHLPIYGNNYLQNFTYNHVEVFEKADVINLKNEYKPSAKDRLYIFPGSNIPRFKVKGFCEANNISVAKFKDKANVWFTNEVNIKDDYFYKFDRHYKIKKLAILGYFGIVLSKSLPNENLAKLIQDISALECDFVLIPKNLKWNIENYGIYYGPKYDFKADWEVSEDKKHLAELTLTDDFYCFISPEKEVEYNNIVNHGNVYHESALVSQLNSELVMDKEIYEGMVNLFESSDKNDHKIAMESMANCNFLKSAVYLLFLVKDHRYKMYNSDMRHHINFKSFCKFFDIDIKNTYLDLDDIVKILLDKDVMNQENLNILMPLAEEVIFNRCNMQYFKAINVVPDTIILDSVKKHNEKIESKVEVTIVEEPKSLEEQLEAFEIPTPELSIINFYL